jgi:hypothetical protein
MPMHNSVQQLDCNILTALLDPQCTAGPDSRRTCVKHIGPGSQTSVSSCGTGADVLCSVSGNVNFISTCTQCICDAAKHGQLVADQLTQLQP